MSNLASDVVVMLFSYICLRAQECWRLINGGNFYFIIERFDPYVKSPLSMVT